MQFDSVITSKALSSLWFFCKKIPFIIHLGGQFHHIIQLKLSFLQLFSKVMLISWKWFYERERERVRAVNKTLYHLQFIWIHKWMKIHVVKISFKHFTCIFKCYLCNLGNYFDISTKQQYIVHKDLFLHLNIVQINQSHLNWRTSL